MIVYYSRHWHTSGDHQTLMHDSITKNEKMTIDRPQDVSVRLIYFESKEYISIGLDAIVAEHLLNHK